jgi:molybdenum cofactor cytidylyltransferase
VKFGSVSVDEACGAILAHSVRYGAIAYKKGHRISSDDMALLKSNGCTDLVVAHVEHDDVSEDDAAYLMAQAIKGTHIRIDPAFTGRANMFATSAGLLRIDCAGINAINALDERLTIATLPDFRHVVEGEMVATVKIIPFAIPHTLLQSAVQIASSEVVQIVPFKALNVGVISTVLPSLKTSTLEKTLLVLAQRLERAKGKIMRDVRIEHSMNALTQALEQMKGQVDLIIIFGASAITDRRDIIPSALEAVGGRIEQLGMPVDPGNLLLLGELDIGTPVIGAPGCARSPVENGFDWILQRLLAGLKVQAQDIRAMGVGGLLMEIISRPQPRAGGEAHDED